MSETDYLDMTGVNRLLDLGGGSGVVSLALLRQHPHLTSTAVGIEDVCIAGREIAQENSLSEPRLRLAHTQTNARTSEQGHGMASNEVRPGKWTTHKHTWQTLIEFYLSAEPGSERLAADRVAEAMHGLHWPAAQLQQLKLVLAQAARRAAECSCRYDSQGALVIRVLILDNDPSTRETNQAHGETTPLQAPEAEVHQTTLSPSRGWGFFMIEKAVPNPEHRDVRYRIELYLYPEGAEPDPNSS